MRHRNPYRINDPNNIYEVAENSSHPELNDARRIYRFKAYTFHTATELEKFFEKEGLDIRRYSMEPKMVRNHEHGKSLIVVDIIEQGHTRNDRAVARAKRAAAGF